MAGEVIRGDIKLQVSPSGMEAILKFFPSQKGQEWTLEKFVQLLENEKINDLKAGVLDDAIKLFLEAKAPTQYSVAKGTPAEDAKPESITLEPLITPPRYAQYESKIRSIIIEPKLKATDGSEVDKKFELKLKNFIWVPKDTDIARIIPSSAEKSGKNVRGEFILPKKVADLNFYLGDNLIRKGNRLFSTDSGFLRVAEQWADIIPFKTPEYKVELSNNKTTALLTFEPGHNLCPIPKGAEIISEAVKLGLEKETLISAQDVDALIQEANSKQINLSKKSISQDKDASVKVTISPDKMRATLTILKGIGNGKSLQDHMVAEAISGKKFVGMNIEKIRADIKNFIANKDLELLDYPLITGTPPVRGKNRVIAMDVSFLPEENAGKILQEVKAFPKISTSLQDQKEYPLENVQNIALIKKGQIVSRFGMPAFGKTGVDIYGTRLPALPGVLPPLKLYENLSQTDETIISETEGVLLYSKFDDILYMRALPYRESSISVSVSEDAMEATISLTEGYGFGKLLSLPDINVSILEAGVVAGIDEKLLQSIIAEAQEKGSSLGKVFAKGKPAIDTGGFKLDWLIEIASGSAVSVRQDGSADYKNQDKTTLVNAGDLLVNLTPIGQQGEDGFNVRGEVFLSQKDPQAVDVPEYDGTIQEEIREDGSKTLIAVENGELKLENNVLKIYNTRKINGDVGQNTGNIRFPGEILVTGTVLSGYAIISSRDINIVGSVEASLLSSDTNINIKGGIKGAGKAMIRAKKNIRTSFAEQAMLLAVEGITATNSIFLCNVKTNGKVVLTSDKGHFIGGNCQARKGMEVQNLGAKNGAKTRISFGQDYLIKNSIDAETREIEKVKSLILQTDEKMVRMEATGMNLDAIRKDKLKLMKVMEKRTMRIFELNEKFEEHFDCEIIVRGTLYPGVIIESHGRDLEIKEERRSVRITFDQSTGKVLVNQYKPE